MTLLMQTIPRVIHGAIKRYALHAMAIVALVLSMGGTWTIAADANAAPTTSSSLGSSHHAAHAKSADAELLHPTRPPKKAVTGKLNLNTATEEQLMLLPSIGPSKAERIVTWRKKNGAFKRTADLRRVKGFGYKTFKRLEPYLDIKGETTLAAKR